MKPKLVFKSLAELPSQAISFAASMPERAAEASRQIIVPPVRATRREIREARRRSAEFMRDFYGRATSPFRYAQPWPRGGINE
jgi:hypothetical protein